MIACLVLGYSLCGFGQYVPPLDGPLLVTGTFGELRSDHYHGGIDFRAAVGTPVRAVADGYVSRVLVSPAGFGQAIYVDHPDGKRSVYGHLEAFAPEILDTVRSLQYREENFALDFRPDSTAFPVRRGQVIGGVGNRGFSFGPHLHFEIRESATDAQLNPLSLGFPVPDTRTPELQRLRLYQWTAAGQEAEPQTYDLTAAGLPDTIRIGHPLVGFGLKAIDRQNRMPNRNGPYLLALAVDSSEVFGIDFDRVPIEKTQYINALTDYREWQRRSSWYYLLYAETPAAVFWDQPAVAPGGGRLTLEAGTPRKIEITATDYAGNAASLHTVVLYDATAAEPAALRPVDRYQYILPAAEASIIDTAGMRFELPAGALYHDLGFKYVRLSDESAGYLSDTHQLHDPDTPLQGRARLWLQPRTPAADSLRAKMYIGKCNDDGTHQSVGGTWQEDGGMATTIGSFGSYALLLDTLPPTVRIKDFRTDLRGRGGFSLLLEEESGGPLRYRGTVDGEWVLLEYDAKSNTLSYRFDGKRYGGGTGEHRFELTVSDARENTTTFVRNFRR